MKIDGFPLATAHTPNQQFICFLFLSQTAENSAPPPILIFIKIKGGRVSGHLEIYWKPPEN